jgi:hypothetical protein
MNNYKLLRVSVAGGLVPRIIEAVHFVQNLMNSQTDRLSRKANPQFLTSIFLPLFLCYLVIPVLEYYPPS